MQTLLIMEIPRNWPLPRYRLLQSVECYPEDEGLYVRGLIYGLIFDGEGWLYRIEPDPDDPTAWVEPLRTVAEENVHLLTES